MSNVTAALECPNRRCTVFADSPCRIVDERMATLKRAEVASLVRRHLERTCSTSAFLADLELLYEPARRSMPTCTTGHAASVST